MKSLEVTITCSVDELSDGILRGWASAGRKAPPLKLRLMIDGEEAGQVVCNEDRPDVRSASFALISGFRYVVPHRYRDGRLHLLQLRNERGQSLPFLVDGVAKTAAGFRLQEEHGATLIAAVADQLKSIGQKLAQESKVSR